MQNFSIHIIGQDNCDKDGGFFLAQCAMCMDGKSGDLIRYSQYWKMPQCLNVYIQYPDLYLEMEELIPRFGSHVASATENEAIFDIHQGSIIHLEDVRW